MMQSTIMRRRPAPELDLTGLAKQAFQPWADAYETWRSGVSDLLERPGPKGRTGCDCGCKSCEPDRCACRCCVADSDLLLEARVGERRIITLVIENRWRRERDIELELSSWTKTAEGVEIKAAIVSPTSFKLEPCGEAQVVIEVAIAGAAVAGADKAGAGNQRTLADVAGCAVSYADLRIKGCDLRSVRIAVAVPPRDCDAYRVDCACGCC
jgi:hypothetical protein